MQRSSPSIGTLAAALAKAQGELVNPGEVVSRHDSSGWTGGSRTDLSLCAVIQWARYRAQGFGPA
jgi:hypothetical protein